MVLKTEDIQARIAQIEGELAALDESIGGAERAVSDAWADTAQFDKQSQILNGLYARRTSLLLVLDGARAALKKSQRDELAQQT